MGNSAGELTAHLRRDRLARIREDAVNLPFGAERPSCWSVRQNAHSVEYDESLCGDVGKKVLLLANHLDTFAFSISNAVRFGVLF
jgi:hypothetical protein